MDMEQTARELQKFADANSLNLDVHAVLDVIDAGDFVEINQAMENSDNRAIMQILQKYKARTNENFKFFNGTVLSESDSINLYNNMGFDELLENYKQFVNGALFDCTHLTMNELRTLVYEDLTSTITSANQVSPRTATDQPQMDPLTQNKMKQADLQKNQSNPNFKVAVPGSGGADQLTPVVGVDVGKTPEQTLVVTKDPSRANQVNVFGLDDVNPVSEEDEIPVHNDDHQEEEVVIVSGEPSMGDLSSHMGHEESDYEESEETTDEILAQIMDFCSRLGGMK